MQKLSRLTYNGLTKHGIGGENRTPMVTEAVDLVLKDLENSDRAA